MRMAVGGSEKLPQPSKLIDWAVALAQACNTMIASCQASCSIVIRAE